MDFFLKQQSQGILQGNPQSDTFNKDADQLSAHRWNTLKKSIILQPFNLSFGTKVYPVTTSMGKEWKNKIGPALLFQKSKYVIHAGSTGLLAIFQRYP